MNRYSNITKIRNTNEFVGTLGDLYYETVNYPEVRPSDRLDRLAFQFYGDVTLYWIIALANPNTQGLGSLFIPVGTQLAIPTNISGFIDSYNRLNEL